MNAYRPLSSDDDVLWIIAALADVDEKMRNGDGK